MILDLMADDPLYPFVTSLRHRRSVTRIVGSTAAVIARTRGASDIGSPRACTAMWSGRHLPGLPAGIHAPRGGGELRMSCRVTPTFAGRATRLELKDHYAESAINTRWEILIGLSGGPAWIASGPVSDPFSPSSICACR